MTQDLESSAPIPPPKVPSGPKLSDLFGMADARAWAEALIRDFALWRVGEISWSDTDHACVLHGPPGTGKTTLGRAVAARLNVPHIEASFATWQGAPGGHLGTTIEAMQQTFALARKHKPCLITVDELDSIPARSAGGQNPTYFNSVTNAMLTELDVAMKVEGVIIIGTCNHPEMLDPALVRPGRMDRLIAVHLPNAEELKGILRFHLTCQRRRNSAAVCRSKSAAEMEAKRPPIGGLFAYRVSAVSSVIL